MSAIFLDLFSIFVFCRFASTTLSQSVPQLNLGNAKDQVIVRPRVAVTLECPVRNAKDLMFDWSKDNEYIMSYGSHRLRKLTNGSLRIKETSFEDTGVYKCRAVNGFGSVEFNVTLLVIGNDEDYELYGDTMEGGTSDTDETKLSLTAKPRLLYVTKDGSPMHREPGSTFRLQCVATGYPKPEMMWYKDGIPVSHVFRFGRWALKFTRALSTDSGNYTCVAQNPLGSTSHSWKLMVDENANESLLLVGKNVTLQEGEKAIIECGVRGNSFPHIEWLKQVFEEEMEPEDFENAISMDGEYFAFIKTTYTIDYMVKDGIHHHQLVIEDVQTKESGKYVCLGANGYGYEYRFSYLEVLPKILGFQSSVPFPIVVTAVVVAIALLGCVISLICYCRPEQRTGSGDNSTELPMVTKEDFLPMHAGPPLPSRCVSNQLRDKSEHQVTYFVEHSNGMV